MGAEDFQEVREPVAMEGMSLDPTFPKRILVSNILRRCVLWGFSESLDRFLSLKASAAGELLVDDVDGTAALDAIQAAVEGTLEVNDADGEVLLTAIAGALAGTLTVSGADQIPDAFKQYGDTSGDGWSGYTTFGIISRVITIICETNPVTIELKDKNGDAMGVIQLPADTGLSLDLRTTAYRHINTLAGNNAVHQLIASYIMA